MNISNLNQVVPDQVRDLFFGYVPFGSDYVMFCSNNNNGVAEYTLLYRKIGEKSLSRVVCRRSSATSDWVVSSSSLDTEYDGFSLSAPYYAYSNIEGQGRYTVSPTGQNLAVLMLVVIASCFVLKIVFGGIRLWSNRKSSIYS